MAVLGVKLNPQSSSLANFVWFAPFFPWHLHTFHTFCFMNDVIITLNRTDSSHYVKLLYKGKVAYGYTFHFSEFNQGYGVIKNCTYFLFAFCIMLSLNDRCCVKVNKTLKDYQHCGQIMLFCLLLLYLSAICSGLLQKQ